MLSKRACKASFETSSMNYAVSMMGWIKNNKKEAMLLGLILLVGAFFRLYRISEYMTFLGDEGRDAIVVRRLLVNFDPILVGPGTSIGNMYLGPLYYYMIAPALLLANFSPVGPAVMIALLGVVTIFFVWFVTHELFTFKGETLQVADSGESLTRRGEHSVHNGALIAAGLYAISPVVINYSRSSWNPNIMPFFSLLCIYAIWQTWKYFNFKWLVVMGIAFAFVLQSHYLGLLLAPVICIFWILTLLSLNPSPITYHLSPSRDFLKYSLIGLGLFLLLMSPLIVFDARHGWRNFSAIRTFFSQRETTISIKPWKSVPNLWPIFKDDYVARLVAGGNELAGRITAFTLLISTVFYLAFNNKKLGQVFAGKKNFLSGVVLVSIWIFFGIVGLSLYKQHIYDHYFGFIFPALFILVGAISQKIWDKFGYDGKILVTSGFCLLVVVNLLNNPLRYPPNAQMWRAIEVAKLIDEKAGGQEFNLAVIAQQNYEDGYQYFLEKHGAKVMDIDAQKPETVKSQLFVVCELPEVKCDPTHNSKTEVANFGWSKIESEWEVEGLTLYKLVHTK